MPPRCAKGAADGKNDAKQSKRSFTLSSTCKVAHRPATSPPLNSQHFHHNPCPKPALLTANCLVKTQHGTIDQYYGLQALDPPCQIAPYSFLPRLLPLCYPVPAGRFPHTQRYPKDDSTEVTASRGIRFIAKRLLL